MNKIINGLKLYFSRIGINSIDGREIVWIVGMHIFYEDGSKKRALLSDYPWISTGEKKKLDVSATITGFVIPTLGENRIYHFYNAAGEPTGKIPAADVGELFQIDERAVVFRQGDHVRFYSIDARLIGERDLTAKEIADFADSE